MCGEDNSLESLVVQCLWSFVRPFSMCDILFNAHQRLSCCRSRPRSSVKNGRRLGSKSWKRL